MKKLLLFLLVLPIICGAQEIDSPTAQGGKYEFNPDKIVCLTDANRASIQLELNENWERLEKSERLNFSKTSRVEPRFSWPVKKSSNAEFNDVWAVDNFVDHNPAGPNQLLDYNCGTRTYDTNSGYDHRGIDMYLWPFTWYQFENNAAEVVAAAPGIITLKHDGEFDKSCNFNSNQWNAVYITHSDGSVAWYGHLKSGSLTNKGVGESVVEGEKLGVVGSSGNSTGPHLHFEVYDATGNLVDPFSGPCNANDSWWKSQPDYYQPNINAVFTHDAPPNFRFNECNTIEDTNFQNEFLPNTPIYFAAYLKDQLSGTAAQFSLRRPNGSLLNWSLPFTDTYSASYWYYSFENLADLGTWTFEVSYQGQTLSSTFNVTSSLAVENEQLKEISIGPNPINEVLTVYGDYNLTNSSVKIYNQLGQKMYDQELVARQINLKFLNKGLYFLKVLDNENKGNRTFVILKNL